MQWARSEPDREGPGSSRIEVDGIDYPVHFAGFAADLTVRTGAGASARLSPWTLTQHLAALDKHARLENGEIVFDGGPFCQDVLAAAAVPPEHCGELAPLALWWATCGGEQPVVEGEFVRCGPVRLRLRQWTFLERARGISAASRKRPDGSGEVSLGRYLGAMTRASIVTTEPEIPLGELAGAVPIVAAVVRYNLPPRAEDLGDHHLMAVTLRLCRALGWTPEKLWSTPAPQVDFLQRLLDEEAAPAPKPQSRRRGLADDPDAVVIKIEDG